jgi:hypothetical protein
MHPTPNELSGCGRTKMMYKITIAGDMDVLESATGMIMGH